MLSLTGCYFANVDSRRPQTNLPRCSAYLPPLPLGAIDGTVLMALAVTACIQGWREGGIVDLPVKDD
jgi:hypothetical protein